MAATVSSLAEMIRRVAAVFLVMRYERVLHGRGTGPESSAPMMNVGAITESESLRIR